MAYYSVNGFLAEGSSFRQRICEIFVGVFDSDHGSLRVAEVVLRHVLVNVVRKELHIGVRPVTVPSKLVAFDDIGCAAENEERGRLWLGLAFEHHNVGMIVLKTVHAYLHSLPRFVIVDVRRVV